MDVEQANLGRRVEAAAWVGAAEVAAAVLPMLEEAVSARVGRACVQSAAGGRTTGQGCRASRSAVRNAAPR